MGTWIEHIQATRAKMPKGTSYKDAMVKAKTTWKGKGNTKKVRFSDKGGSIRKPSLAETPVDVRRIETTERLMPEGGVYDDDTDTDTEDEETGAYSHFGGRLSGLGLAYDPPDVGKAMIKTLQGHPEILATYVSGRVPGLPPARRDGLQQFARRDAGATVIDFGGSVNALTHSVDGYLVAHDSNFVHEFHII